MNKPKLRPYTVVGFFDARNVETFVEQVRARDPAHAWDIAARRHRDDDWDDNATEIATFAGHLDPGGRTPAEKRASTIRGKKATAKALALIAANAAAREAHA